MDRNKHWFASWKRAHGLRLPVKKFCMHDHFDQLLAACIVMNIALMSMQSFKPSAAQQNVSTVQNFFFSMLFATEVLGATAQKSPVPRERTKRELTFENLYSYQAKCIRYIPSGT